MVPPLDPAIARMALDHLQVAPAAPDLALLATLLHQYGRRVPWESASRIARAAQSAGTPPPRWSEEFWRDARDLGTGGTCFESNRAFLALLRSLGYEGYLTINDMQETAACHTAIVVTLGGARWVVDAGYPIYAPLRLDPEQVTEATTPYLTYTAEPLGGGRWQLFNRPHPKPYLYTLIDAPVSDADYRAATEADYGPGGLFLSRVIIRKLLGGDIWRFDSAAPSPAVVQFRDGALTEHPIVGDVPAALAQRFGVDEGVIAAAIRSLPAPQPPPPGPG
jgi:N-acetyltransferase